jgi:hypothetical protein
MLLIAALFTSYILQQKRIQAVHETVISIFAGAPRLGWIPIGCRLVLIAHRHGGWFGYTHHTWNGDPGHGQL